MQKQGKKRSRSQSGDGSFVPFHTVFQSATVAGILTVLGNPSNLSPRALAEADAWAHFRLVKLKFRLHPPSQAAGATFDQLMGWIGGVQDTPPSTVVTIGELLPSVVMTRNQTVPTEWIKVSPGDLAGPLPWYKTIPGTADATEEAPGALVFFGSGVLPMTFEVRGLFQFKTSVATANTPDEEQLVVKLRRLRLLSAQEAERKRLLAALAPGRTGGA
jgi:hypothetical protein